MVCGPAPLMLKLITSGTLTLRLAVRIACRNEPGPLSLVLVTESVALKAARGPANKNKATKASTVEKGVWSHCRMDEVMCSRIKYLRERLETHENRMWVRRSQFTLNF